MDEKIITSYIVRNLWCLVYASVIGRERENDETATMAADTAVSRYIKAWTFEEEAP